MAGARAEQPDATLDAVAAVAQRALDNTWTLGVALSPCTVPEAGKPTFTLADNEMDMGMGIHGEPGIRRGPLLPADTLADEMLTTLLNDSGITRVDRFAVRERICYLFILLVIHYWIRQHDYFSDCSKYRGGHIFPTFIQII